MELYEQQKAPLELQGGDNVDLTISAISFLGGKNGGLYYLPSYMRDCNKAHIRIPINQPVKPMECHN